MRLWQSILGVGPSLLLGERALHAMDWITGDVVDLTQIFDSEDSGESLRQKEVGDTSRIMGTRNGPKLDSANRLNGKAVHILVWMGGRCLGW